MSEFFVVFLKNTDGGLPEKLETGMRRGVFSGRIAFPASRCFFWGEKSDAYAEA